MQNGLFVTFEGIDGSGKSTCLNRLAATMKADGRRFLLLREPGGTPFGEAMRAALVNGALPACGMAELLAFNASRAELVSSVIRPALASGTVVLCDRFYDSTIVYQGGVGCTEREVRAACRLAVGGLTPDRTFLFDLSGRAAARRISVRQLPGLDRYDRVPVSTMNRNRDAYLRLAASEKRFEIIDASRDEDAVFVAVLERIAPLLAHHDQHARRR